MRPTARRFRNSRGEFVPLTDDQVAIPENQFAANASEQREIASPAGNIAGIEALISLKNWKFAVTPDRAQVCIWLFIMTTKFLSMLSIASFWFCVVMCVKTIPFWEGPANVLAGFARRRDVLQNGFENVAGDNVWGDLFPWEEALDSYTVAVGLAETGRPGALLIRGYAAPLLIGNPLIWIGLMALSFCNWHFLSFLHGCLKQAHRATKIIARRRSA